MTPRLSQGDGDALPLFTRLLRVGEGRGEGMCILLLLLLLTTTTSACSYLRRGEPLAEPVELIAILPLDRAEDERSDGEDGPQLAPGAERAVTAQLYAVMAESPRWRFVPDITSSDALRRIDARAERLRRARQLGKAVNADAVLCGVVSRFIERVGTDYAASAPAAVSFQLALISSHSGEVLWESDFARRQESLSTNLFDWWMFWEGGPKWLSAAELARVGVESLFDDLDRRMPE